MLGDVHTTAHYCQCILDAAKKEHTFLTDTEKAIIDTLNDLLGKHSVGHLTQTELDQGLRMVEVTLKVAEMLFSR